MAKAPFEAPRPWVEETSDTGDGVVGKLFRSVPEPEALSSTRLAQIHARLGNPGASSRTRRRIREAVLAGAMLLAGASVAVAGWGVSSLLSAARPSATSPAAVAPSAHAPQMAKHATSNGTTLAPATASDALDAGLANAPESAPSLLLAPSAGATMAPASASSTLAAESAALERVLLKLRREHDPAGALELLDQSDALFARGSLALEARVARLDALLALGRKQEALSILNHLPFAQIGRGGELRLVRAELRASTDCALALADFDALTRQSLAPALAERALYGRAACELQVGDSAHARGDFAQYLQQYPQGRFAANVQRQLGTRAEKAP